MNSSHPELIVEPSAHVRHEFFFHALRDTSVSETQVGHEVMLGRAIKFPAGDLISIPQRLHRSSVKEEAAKVFVAEVNLPQADHKLPEGNGCKGGLANHLIALANTTSQQCN